jgi:7,8-dihydropterin-6-yl-methyl-4-(beta-D-ribofuranosyl)aminobenzene 5'-phosphate synthase
MTSPGLQEKDERRLTILADNSVDRRGLLAEHGLAIWVELGSRRVLFDTGQGLVLAVNSRALGVPLERADAIVLSHGHYDHAGGLRVVLCRTSRARVFAHPAAFGDKYARNPDGSSRDISMPGRGGIPAQAHGVLVAVDGPVEVVAGLYATGPVPRLTDFEDTGGPFYTDAACTHPDPLTDDQGSDRGRAAAHRAGRAPPASPRRRACRMRSPADAGRAPRAP